MSKDIAGDYPNFQLNIDTSDILGKSALTFQMQVLNNLREALNNSSLFYCASKQYGDDELLDKSWSLYNKVRDLYEDFMQNFLI